MNRIYTLQISTITHIARGVGQKKDQNQDFEDFFSDVQNSRSLVRSLIEMVLCSMCDCVCLGLCFKLSNGSYVPNGTPGGGGSHLCMIQNMTPDPFSHFSMSPPSRCGWYPILVMCEVCLQLTEWVMLWKIKKIINKLYYKYIQSTDPLIFWMSVLLHA